MNCYGTATIHFTSSTDKYIITDGLRKAETKDQFLARKVKEMKAKRRRNEDAWAFQHGDEVFKNMPLAEFKEMIAKAKITSFRPTEKHAQSIANMENR